METTRRPRTWRSLVLLMAVFLTVGLTTSVSQSLAQSAGSQNGAAKLIRDIHRAGKQSAYPEVVARVNDQPIYGWQLAQTEAFLVSSVAAGNEGARGQDALAILIQQEVLVQSAGKLGLSVSDAEVREFVNALQQALQTSSRTEDRETIAALISELGATPQNFGNDPKVLELYRVSELEALVRQHIVQALPSEQQKDPAAVGKAVSDFVAQQNPTIEILITR